MLNQQIQNYKIISTLGEGGMGTVYLAEHITIQRKVAVKVLHSQLTKNESLRQRFQNEAVLMAKLQHPNIVGLIDFFEQDGNLYLIMEYVEGIGLDDFIKNLNTPVSIERGKNIMLQILNGFAYAHSNGIIHRDVKPSNILITKNDEVKILDFGIAKMLDDVKNKLTKTGTQIGTAYYMSPEQVKAQELDQRTDIYSLGITFYELLSGFCPYTNSQSEYDVYRRIVEEPLIPLTESLGLQYSHVWGIIEKQTQKNKEWRYSNCSEILKDLTSETVIESKKPEAKEANTIVEEREVYITPPVKKKQTKIFLIVISIIIFSFFAYFLNSETKNSKEFVNYVVVSEINLRSKPTKSSNSLLKIPQGDSVLILGDSTNTLEDGFKYKWKKCKYRNKEGWVSTEIDGQKNLGDIDLAEEFKILMANIPNGSYEYHYLRTIVFYGLIDFLKEKGLNRKYSFAQNQYNNKFQTIQKFNFRNNNRVYDCRILLNPINEYDYPLYIVLKLEYSENKIFIKEVYGWKMKRKVKFFKVYNDDKYVDLYDVNEKYIGIHSDGEIEKL
jgi:serine/threonine protein kinase